MIKSVSYLQWATKASGWLLSACAAMLLTSAAANSATILIYGANGNIGGVIVAEALKRGHTVIGVSRTGEKIPVDNPKFSTIKGDVTDPESFKDSIKGVDAVVISVAGSGKDNAPENAVHARAAVTAVKVLTGMKNAPYVLQIGGATTLLETKEAMLKNLPFPAPEGSPSYGMLFGHLLALQTYRASNIDWTVLTPPMDIVGWTPKGVTDSVRTGHYRTSTTDAVKDAAGKNSISVADLAVAAVDEIEKRQFVRKRFTVGY